MNVLLFDTETTGMPLKGVPASDSAQARVMQLGAILLAGDKEVASFYSLLYPDSWPTIHPKAQAAHGISLEDCLATGISQKAALSVFANLVDAADIVVAHNYAFDYQMLSIEYDLLGQVFKPNKHACTMELMTPIMGLKRLNGSPKWPNLAEAYKYCTGRELDGAHDALADVRGCADIWRWLVTNNKV